MHEQLTASIEEVRTFKQAVDQAGHQVIITDRDGTIEYVNSAFEEVTGYEESEVLGETPGILSAGETDSAVYEELWETILAGDTWRDELVNARKTGERYYVEQTIAPVESPDGTIDGFVSIGTDVTRTKLRRQVLEVYNRVLRHDLRNRVNVITGNADVIRTEHARRISQAVEEVRDVLDDLDGVDDSAAELRQTIDELGAAASAARRRTETIEDAARRLERLNDKATKANTVTDFSRSSRRSVPIESVVREGIESVITSHPEATIETDLSPGADPL
ncbi:MAG: PAS domain-containing protein [Halanaeroarchaeum sp.]